MDNSPEYEDEINRLKEEARIEEIKKKAQEDYKAELRAEKSRQRAENYEKFQRENHIKTRHWVPIAIGAALMIGSTLSLNTHIDVIENERLALKVNELFAYGTWIFVGGLVYYMMARRKN